MGIDIKYSQEPENKALTDAMVESIDDHLLSIYKLFKAAHPEWGGLVIFVGDRDDEHFVSRAKALSKDGFRRLIEDDKTNN